MRHLILKLLLIAAVAWPSLAIAQQEVEKFDVNRLRNEKLIEKKGESCDAHTRSAAVSTKNERVLNVGVPVPTVRVSKGIDVAKGSVQQSTNKEHAAVKTISKPRKASAPVLQVPKRNLDVPAGYALIVFVANDVWGDGSGYQMLIDQNATMYDSWNSNGFTQAIYDMAEYTIPENADYNASGNASNFLVGQTGQLVIPAGTYDILIANPTPGDKVYAATDGRIDNYTIAAGNVYTFTVSLNGENDKTTIDVGAIADLLLQPTGLTAKPDDASGKISWESGLNNEGWNLRYRPYVDVLDYNRSWAFPVDGSSVSTGGWILYDYDGDGNNWAYTYNSNTTTDACLYSASYINGTGALTPDNWAISPEVTLGGTLKFKARTNGYDETLGVYVIQGEITNPLVQVGSDLALNSSSTTYSEYTYDLSAFEGHGYVVIRHYNCTDGFYVFVDDIQVLVPSGNTTPPAEGEWTYVNNTTSPHTINGLTNGITYEVQVQGVGNNTTTDWTNSVLFTPVAVPARDIVVKDADFFEGKTYTWVEDGVTKEANLTEIATTPKQMIAMLTKIYTDPTIPGNLKRGFDEQGNNEPWNDCYYSGVGGIKKSSGTSSSSYTNVRNYSYDNKYGWNISGNIVRYNDSDLGMYAFYMDTTQYRPNEEGLTLVLVEMKDDFNPNDLDNIDESNLESFFANSFKSARIISEARRTGNGMEAGTLFKIDCDKMNKFFLLAKGQLRWVNNMRETYVMSSSSSSTYYYIGNQVAAPAYYYMNNSNFYSRSSSGGNTFFTNNSGNYYYYDPPFVDNYGYPQFYHMFEQFSPTTTEATTGKDDLYQLMINMESFGVEHDCASVASLNHQFMMYGEESAAADCQDVRDMMFFIPDYRMLKDDSRDPWENVEKYLYYNKNHQPTMGMYVIRQDAITPTTQADDHYTLQLNWRSNLDDFLPSDEQEFELLQVVINDDGTTSYVSVYYMNENGEYTDAQGNVVDEANKVPIVLHMEAGRVKNYPNVYVARQQSSQQVTYAIRGRDTGHFLSLQMSNQQSYVIPGLDVNEKVFITQSDVYSRYNPELEENCYSNKIGITNDALGLKVANLVDNSTTLDLYRNYNTAVDGTSQTVKELVASFKVVNKANGTMSVTWDNQAAQTEFPAAKDGSGYAGYHANAIGNTYTFSANSNGYVVFDNLAIWDNFIADVSKNEHPGLYEYKIETNYHDESMDAGVNAYSNSFRVPIYKTASQINGSFTQAEVDAENGAQPALGIDENVEFGVDVQYGSKTEIYRYDAYRWNEGETRYIVNEVFADGSEQDLPPTGTAGNQGEYYTVSMNDVMTDDYVTSPDVAVSETETTATATFVDVVPGKNNAAAYTYAPVVEVLSGRGDYNTYGGPLQNTAVGKFSASVVEDPNVPNMSEYTWTVGGDVYAYYNVFLQFNTAKVPAGYDLYKVRVWRQAQGDLLGEKAGEGYESRIGTDIGSGMNSIKYEEITHGTDDECTVPASTANVTGITNYMLGKKHPDANQLVWNATFGARKVRTLDDETGVIDELPLKFIVRAYFTRNENLPASAQPAGAPRRAEGDAQGDGKFYIVQQEIDYVIKNNNIVTAVDNIAASRQVSEVVYYDMAGKASSKPYNGVNVMVTRYTDGTVTTAKVVK